MSKNMSLITSVLCATAMSLGASPVIAQRPGQGDPRPAQEPPPAPPPSRPQPPPPPPPSRDQQDARAEQERQREANARAQQQREQEEQQRAANARAQQEQQRVENARKQQEQQRVENARQQQEQERVAKARQQAAAASAASATPANRQIIGELVAAERVHREQLARINRLKQLAQRQGQKDRVGELDRLLDQSNSKFDAQLGRAKGKLTEPEYTNTVAMLEQGRRREVRQMMGGAGETNGGATPANVTRQRAPEGAREAAPSQPPR